MGTQGANLQRLDGQFLVIDRAGRGGKVEQIIEFPLDVYVIGHVMLDEEKVLDGGCGRCW